MPLPVLLDVAAGDDVVVLHHLALLSFLPATTARTNSATRQIKLSKRGSDPKTSEEHGRPQSKDEEPAARLRLRTRQILMLTRVGGDGRTWGDGGAVEG
jgi:hypothetical protein